MNFLFYRYGSICEPDMISSLTGLGHNVKSITLEVTDKNTPPQTTIKVVSETLMNGNFDAVWSVNYFPILSAVCNIFHIRYICQTVDSPVMELYSDTLSNEWNRIFLFDRQQFLTFAPKNPTHIYHMPLAVNTGRLNEFLDHASCEDRQRFTCDISFVGSLYTEKCPYDRLPSDNGYLNGYLTGIMEAQSKIYGYFFLPEALPSSIVEQFVAEFPDFYIPSDGFTRDDTMAMALLYLGPKITVMERERILTLLGEKYPLDLFTRSSASHLPVRLRGGVSTLTEMPLIFQNSAINLNPTAKSIRSGIPLRVFDILGCGGFMLSNYQEELGELFTIGEDLDVYTCEEDLLEKTTYYLEHEAIRKEMAHAAWEKIQKYHSYEIRLDEIIRCAFSN